MPGVRGVFGRMRPAVHPDHRMRRAPAPARSDLVGDQLLRASSVDFRRSACPPPPRAQYCPDAKIVMMFGQRVDGRVPRVGAGAGRVVDRQAGVVADARAAADRVVAMVDVFVQRAAHSPERSFCASAGAGKRDEDGEDRACLPLDRNSIDVNPSDVDEAAPAMAASGHQIGEPDLVHLAQVRLLDPAAGFRRLLSLGVNRRDGVDVEPQPADRRDGELRLDRVLGRAVGPVVASSTSPRHDRARRTASAENGTLSWGPNADKK